MSSDITFEMLDGVFNMRIGAIIIRDNKVLLVNNGLHYYSVGGRVKMHETYEQAVIREAYEELGVHLKIERLLFTNESFFTLNGGSSKYSGKRFHEISFFFLMKDDEKISANRIFDQSGEWLEWVPIADLPKHLVYPLSLQDVLKDLPKTQIHITTKE